MSASLFFNFLFELTSMAPKTRFKVFRAELTKVFMTLVMFYFLTLCFTTWMYSMAQSIQFTVKWREDNLKNQRNNYNTRVNRLVQQGSLTEDEVPPFYAKDVFTETELVIREFEQYGLTKVSI